VVRDLAEQPLGLRRIEPLVRILPEQPADDRPQRSRAGGFFGLVEDHGGESRKRGVTLERRMPLNRCVQGGT
jgi:hypothetical protein